MLNINYTFLNKIIFYSRYKQRDSVSHINNIKKYEFLLNSCVDGLCRQNNFVLLFWFLRKILLIKSTPINFHNKSRDFPFKNQLNFSKIKKQTCYCLIKCLHTVIRFLLYNKAVS